MTRLIAFLAVLLLATPRPGVAQELTAEQEEVWSTFSQGIAHWVAEDIEALYEHVHPDFVWWNNGNSVPGDYDAAWTLDTASAELEGKWLSYDLTPLTIQIHGDHAVINAYMRGFREDGRGGTPTWTTMRFHENWMKEDGRWRLIANYLHFEGPPDE